MTQPGVSDNEGTIILPRIIEELEGKLYLDPRSIRERLRKILAFANIKMDDLKNDKDQVFFYTEEKELVKALLIELNNSYLEKLTSKKPVGKTIEANFEEAKAFRQRMLEKLNEVTDEEIKQSWLGVIEILSRYELYQWQIKWMDTIKQAAKQVVEMDLDYDNHVRLVKELHHATVSWMEKNLHKS